MMIECKAGPGTGVDDAGSSVAAPDRRQWHRPVVKDAGTDSTAGKAFNSSERTLINSTLVGPS